MAISKTGNAGVYAFDVAGNISKDDSSIRYLAWHISLGGSCEITVDGKLDCYVNGQLIQGSGTIVYKIQPDDSYVGVEKLRPMKQSMECHGLLMPPPSLLTDGSLGLTITNNASGKGTVRVKVKGQEDKWESTPKKPKKGNPDRDLAKDYDKASQMEYGVSLKDISGMVKVFKFPTIQADACSRRSGLYPASGDLYDLAFRLQGLTPGACAIVVEGQVQLTPADLPAAGTAVTSLLGGQLLLAGSGSGYDTPGTGDTSAWKATADGVQLVDTVLTPSHYVGTDISELNGALTCNPPGFTSGFYAYTLEFTMTVTPDPNVTGHVYPLLNETAATMFPIPYTVRDYYGQPIGISWNGIGSVLLAHFQPDSLTHWYVSGSELPAVETTISNTVYTVNVKAVVHANGAVEVYVNSDLVDSRPALGLPIPLCSFAVPVLSVNRLTATNQVLGLTTLETPPVSYSNIKFTVDSGV